MELRRLTNMLKVILTFVFICALLPGVNAQTHSLNGNWYFKTDPYDLGEQQEWFKKNVNQLSWRKVEVPHTWNVDQGLEEYFGKAWYSKKLVIDPNSLQDTLYLEFNAVYRDSKVWLNGQLLKENRNSGWTKFTVPIDKEILKDVNTLTVLVDNQFSSSSLPIDDSFDWANDGGIIRDVNLISLPSNFVGKILVDSVLDQNLTTANVTLQGFINMEEKENLQLVSQIFDPNGNQVAKTQSTLKYDDLQSDPRFKDTNIHLSQLPKKTLSFTINAPELWHFDLPKRYIASMTLMRGTEVIHQNSTTFGIRKITLKNGFYYLNNEPMRLMGVEWMPGSNPLTGMAASKENMLSILKDMKELNVLITRFHWQQDPVIFEFMDENGMLTQEEIPSWQKSPENDAVYDTQRIQTQSMVFDHYNFASIYAWGIGNEMGESGISTRFVNQGEQIFKQLNPNRLTTYASHKLHLINNIKQAQESTSNIADFIEWNEYFESWNGGTVADVKPALDRLKTFYPNKSVVISEYGLCECQPEFIKGDQRRIEILDTHTNVYRHASNVAGAIFFSYNDYRTHMGDKGQGEFQQRVHGVTDLHGEKKPSWYELKQQASPLKKLAIKALDSSHTLEGEQYEVILQTRSLNDLPAYTLHQYKLIWTAYDEENLPIHTGSQLLPKLTPGTVYRHKLKVDSSKLKKITVEVFRPTGYSVQKFTYTPTTK